MPDQPAQDTLHIDSLLTNVSLKYKNQAYISDQLFPIVPVKKQSDIITKYNRSFWFRNEAVIRGPGTKSRRGGYTVDTSQHYFCNRFSYGKEVADETRDNADSVFNLDRDATEYTVDKLQMAREINFANTFFTTGVWSGGDPTGGTDFTKWDDYSNSSPLVDLTKYQDEVEGLIAVQANTMVMGKQV